MLEAVIIGRWRSTPGLFSMRRRILRLRRFNWPWRLAFTRKPPGGRTVEGVKCLDCSPKPGGFRASRPRSALDYTCLRIRAVYLRVADGKNSIEGHDRRLKGSRSRR